MESGNKINLLTFILDTGERTKFGHRIGLWGCECGNEKKIPIQAVSGGGTKSCGCLHKATAKALGEKSKGKKLSAETIQKISEALSGRVSPNKGKPPSDETKKKMSEARRGKPAFWNVGKVHTEETKRKFSISHLGQKAWNKGISHTQISGDKSRFWKGGITPINAKIRHSIEYKQWRTSVFERDQYTCVFCGKKNEVSGKLNADHIMPFALFPELRFEVSNGRTLCESCHKETDTYLFKMNGKKRADFSHKA